MTHDSYALLVGKLRDTPAFRPRVMAGGRMKDRRIAITGAASGIGRRTAEIFAAQGASLLLLDRDAIENSHASFAVDVTDEAGLLSAVERGAAVLGGLDGLVTCAGIMWRGSVPEAGAANWRYVIEVNLTGTYLAVRAALPFLEQAQNASIVTVGSAMGLFPNIAERTAYAASKGGVVSLTRALAAELGPNIRVNCVCPGLVDTPMADGVRGNFGNYALGRLADPTEIANALLFLTSQEASYVTGATLAADGGRSFH